ncbi:hypothetical protein IMSAGC011_01268 [Lachnospiraceae bacterium]|nr:hypothetical protein IMSAGC011_01268 [Lachnospiraceae bacterium]
MKKCIIFGCGKIGKAAYEKLREYYEVIAWSDNNQRLHGQEINGIPVIRPSDIPSFTQKYDLDVFVSIFQTSEVVNQLRTLGISNSYVWKEGFFFSSDGLFPLEFPVLKYHKKGNDTSLHVLFVSNVANIRDHKMAALVKKAGEKAFLAYIVQSPHDEWSQYIDLYEEIYQIMSLQSLLDFVKNSEFDIVHCSSEPDHVTPVLIHSGKTVIHDCHDLRSSSQSMSPDKLALEYLAHSGAAGVIYPTDSLRDEAVRKFALSKERTLVIENYPFEDLLQKEKKQKLSDRDGEIHCVYEGGITHGNKECRRYFEKIWLKLAEAGLHIHYYSQSDEKYCRFLETLHPRFHYEGNVSSYTLSSELTRYDVGLCIYNSTPKYQLYLEYSSPNKLYEYVNAGIPVAVGDIKSHILIVEANNFGKYIDFNGDIMQQMKEIVEIEIPFGVLEEKGFTFDSKTAELMKFYETVHKHAQKGV